MMRKWLCLLILFFPLSLAPEPVELLVVWNIGQGQWVTAITPHFCHHFDMGGEARFFDKTFSRVRHLCHRKWNRLSLSHGDLDHIRWVARVAQRLPRFCLQAGPGGPMSPAKKRMLQRVSRCHTKTPAEVTEHTHIPAAPTATSNRNANYFSLVFLFKNLALLPGDAPSGLEKYWRLPEPQKIRWLVLGHHGSRTSTSHHLLRKLSGLKQAIASSRKAMYGHPHFEIQEKLQKYHVPLLRTEDWGSIGFEI